jgi:hypothetical protein
MGLDSVELVIAWEGAFGIEIPDHEAQLVRTPRMATELIARKLRAVETPHQPCLTQRAFHRLREALRHATGATRQEIRPSTKLRHLVTTDRHRTWAKVIYLTRLPSLPRLGWFTPRTVGSLARWAGAYAAKDLLLPGEAWTYGLVRTVMRSIITEQQGIAWLHDDDDFVRDLGLD